MSEERETPVSRAAESSEDAMNPGAPVEETAASQTEVLAAVERSRAGGAEGETTTLAPAAAGSGSADRESDLPIVEAGDAASEDSVEHAFKVAASQVDTELDIDVPDSGRRSSTGQDLLPALDELPSAAHDTATPERDGEIRIAADHPMAALYMQTPMPPEIRGNRLAGVLIALVATAGFAIVHAGVVALTLAPSLAPSQFVDGLLAHLLSWSFLASVAVFFLALVVLVLIVGRAGWWAYVLGGFLVAAAVWVATTLGLVVDENDFQALLHLSPAVIAERFGLTVPALAAAIVAREATVWFGAWIGARGRRMKMRNAAALAEYEQALEESKTPQSGTAAGTAAR